MRIALFIACYNDTLFPATGRAVVQVLERLGHTVDFPEAQTCCGQMHFNTGYRADAYLLAKRVLKQFADADVVCTPSSSCAAMMRENYRELAAENEDAAMIAAVDSLHDRVFEFTELLTDKLGIEDVGATFAERVVYHPSCHGLRTLCLGDKPTRLLRAVRGLELVPLPDAERCCGFGGTFAIKNAEVSGSLLREKVDAVLSTGAGVVTAVDNSCLMHLAGLLHRESRPVRTMHVAEILACTGEGRPQ